MGVSIKGRGAVSKTATPPTGPRKDGASRPARGGIISATAQRAILRQAGASDISMKEARVSGARGGLVELKVTGWEKSKASGDADRGVSSLIKWLEKKASTKLGSRVRSVKIKKVCCRQHQYQHADRRASLCQQAITSGPPSFAANLRTTTAIQVNGQRLPSG